MMKLFAALVLCVMMLGHGPAEAGAQPTEGPRIIDLSHHNTVADWDAVSGAGISVVILKATDGMTYVDPTFVDRFEAIGGKGFVRGAYHFYEVNDAGADQAAWFIKNVTLTSGDLPPIVDIERIVKPVHGDLHTEFTAFLTALETHFGVKPIIYTGRNFWDHAMKAHLPQYPLWIAQYEKHAPDLPDGWPSWTMWQHTESASVAGVAGNVDSSVFNGQRADLDQFVMQAD